MLVLEGVDIKALEAQQQEKWNEIPLTEHFNRYLQQGMTQKEAMKAVASDRGVSKREIYAQLLKAL